MFYQLLLCVLLSTNIALGFTIYTISFHESHAPLLSQWASVTEICYMKDNKCWVPFDLFDDTYGVHRFRRSFFAAYVVVTRSSGLGSSSATDPSHDVSVWEYLDEACRGEAVERVRQPGSRVRTRNYEDDGISAVALGDPEPDPAESKGFQFPDLVLIEGMRYLLDGSTVQGCRFVKANCSARADLPGYVLGRPFFNVSFR